jgi:hypothetical protein
LSQSMLLMVSLGVGMAIHSSHLVNSNG